MTCILWLWLSDIAAAQSEAAPPPDSIGALDAVISHVERFADVRYEATDGVVRLTGTVSTVRARDELETLVARQPSTVFVDNQLSVDQAPTEAGPEERDLEIEEQLVGSLARVEDLAGITVEVQGGVVRLGGSVIHESDRQKVVDLAEGMDGVLLVDNDISLQNGLRGRLEPALDDTVDWVASVIAFLPIAGLGLLTFGLSLGVGKVVQRLNILYRGVAHRPLLRAMMGRLVVLASAAVGLVLCLQIMGLSGLASAVVGTAGVASVAAGFALKDVVENYLAGILLSVQQPFSKDDFVEIGGDRGVVVRLSMRNTLLITVDGNHVFVPNAAVFRSVVTNFSRNPRRRFSFQVGVGVDEDLMEVLKLGVRVLQDMPKVLSAPGPSLQIAALGDSNVLLDVYGWVDQVDADFFAVRTEAIRRIKNAFDSAGFDMPEPIYRVAIQDKSHARRGTERPPSQPHETAVTLEADRTIQEQAEQERIKEGDALDLPSS